MRRITLSSDITDPVKPSGNYSEYDGGWQDYLLARGDYEKALAHARSERARHDAWHATFNAATKHVGSCLYLEDSVSAANFAHGNVKWFGTDENV